MGDIMSKKLILLLSCLLFEVSTLHCAQNQEVALRVRLNDDLIAALLENNRDAVNDAVAEGADINFIGVFGFTPLMRVSRIGRLEAMRLLLDLHADIDFRNPRNERNALMVASEDGQAGAINLLLDRRANMINLVDRAGYTALMLACINAQSLAVEALINRGANVNARSRNQDTALSIARHVLQKGEDLVAMYLAGPKRERGIRMRDGSLEIINLLRGAGAV